MLEFVITDLEMTAPSTHVVHPPANLKIAFLRAEEPTLHFYRYLYDTVGEPWLWWERRAMSDDDLAAAIHHEDVHVYVLYVNGVPGGYAELDFRPKPDVDLAYFGLVPEFTGRRLGPYLLYAALDAAWARGPQRVTVNTCNWDHPKAVHTYQRAGFVPYGQRRKQVPDPRDLGHIPRSVIHRNDETGGA